MVETNQKDGLALDIRNLTIYYEVDGDVVKAVNDVSLQLENGKTLGLVGETGAGKTSTALAILKMIPDPPGIVKSGEISVFGHDIRKATKKQMESIRGGEVSMIFQDPMTSLNPVLSVGEQIAESIMLHIRGIHKKEAYERAMEMLGTVGIPRERAFEYPHQFSGGMKQRVGIAIALACNPRLLIADEPTTALDVTIQAQVLDLMRKLRDEYKMSMLMITHDLGIVAEVCDEVAVMYAGRIVERGTLREVFKETKHPYTEGLFNSLPNLQNRMTDLIPIPGMMPDPANLPEGCAFADRCSYATEVCRKAQPALHRFSETHSALCTAYDAEGFHIRRNHNG